MLEDTAVVPKSQIILEIAAATPLSGKTIAPIPHCCHGLMPLFACDGIETNALTNTAAVKHLFIIINFL